MKKEEQAPSLPNLGDDNLEAIKQKQNKTKQKREQTPLLPKVSDGIAKTTKKKTKKGELSSLSTEI
jgi:hypothetical protein